MKKLSIVGKDYHTDEHAVGYYNAGDRWGALWGGLVGSAFFFIPGDRPAAGAGVRISMDGRGCVFDNIFIERLWRSVNYEDVYLKGYEGVLGGLRNYFESYNRERLHQALDYRTPETVYRGRA